MVYIAEVGSEEKIPVPVDKDNSLPLKRLDRYFPGAVGLYFEENGTEKIPVAFDETDTMLIPPDGDWSSRVFYVVHPRVSRPTTPSRVYTEDILPTVDRCRKFMLYTLITEVSPGVFEDGSIRSCVTVASSRFAFMAGHCLPKGYPIGKIFKIMVYIAEVGSEEKIPVPVDKDNSLPLKRLDRYFPGAVGLYFEENGTEKIPVAFDETDTMLIPPDGDWSSRVFYVVHPRVSRPTTPSRVYTEDILPTVDRCRKFMLYTLITEVSPGVFEDGSIRSCVTVASSRFAFMAGHCLPKGYPIGKIFKVYDSNGRAYDVRLVLLERYENSGDDFAVVEVQNGQFLDFPSTIGSPYQGAPYFIFGYDGEYPHADLSYFKGTVRNTNIYQSQNYIIGSPGTTSGCSGGGVFSLNGDLYGICVSGRLVTGSNLATLDSHFQTLRLKLSEPSYSHIVPGHYLMANIPNRKRKREEIDTSGPSGDSMNASKESNE